MISRQNSGHLIPAVDLPPISLAFATRPRAGLPRASSPVVIYAGGMSGAFSLFPEIQYRTLSLDIPAIFIHFISIDRVFHPADL